ncbi:MAG: hypothetical protein RIS91_1450, partial [Bacteroidota bacterium]
ELDSNLFWDELGFVNKGTSLVRHLLSIKISGIRGSKY